jgi:flagellar motility protein MotE (MotC chaperone)
MSSSNDAQAPGKHGRSILSSWPRRVRDPMLKLAHRTKILLLVTMATLANASPVPAQTGVKSSKPLNLLAFARASRPSGVQKPSPPATPPSTDNASGRATGWAAEDATPLITGATPAPDNSAAAGRPAKTGSVTAPPKPASPAANAPENDVAQFCSNVIDPAVDARLAWQLKELEKAENQLRERIAEVEAKRTEYEKWMALRDEFLKKAEAGVVDIYSRMRPEAAALQIAGMADDTAAAVLVKLSPRNSSAIFNEMDSARAAHLADLLGGMRRVDDGKTTK